MLIPRDNAINYKLGTLKETKFTFSHIFDMKSNQEDIYNITCQPLVSSLIKGNNGLLFTYGVTGSGKTFTMTGNFKIRGIMPRCLDSLFKTISYYQAPKFTFKPDKMNGFEALSDKDTIFGNGVVNNRNYFKCNNKNLESGFGLNSFGKDCVDINNMYAVFITYVEVYNNCVYDLLEENVIQNRNALQSRLIREDGFHNMYVHGVTELEVTSVEEAIQAFNVGQKRKKIGHTILNAESSRSHSIFTIRLVQAPIVAQSEKKDKKTPLEIKISQLSLVDLAGSERLSRTQNTGQRLKEAGNINNSLMTLRNCLELLRENQMHGSFKKIPYRDSKLTNLFKNYFDGHGTVKMIVCVNPRIEDYDENSQVMKFAEIAQEVHIPKLSLIKSSIENKNKSKLRKKIWSDVCYTVRRFPKSDINSPNKTSVIKDISSYLATRIKQRQEISEDLYGTMNTFRKQLVEINTINSDLKEENVTVTSCLKKDKQSIRHLEKKLQEHSSCLYDVNIYVNELQEKKLKLKRRLDEQKGSIEKKKKDLTYKKDILIEKIEQEKLKLKIELKKKLFEEKNVETKNQKDTQKKLLLAKDIKNSYELENYKTKKYPNFFTPLPLINSNYRRSKSAERWVEHRAKETIPLGTIFQPFYKSRKSVNRLDESDLTSRNLSNYCLVDQVARQSGEVETKLYKGEIIPTLAGGAQVVFNDVECLTQISSKSIVS